VLQAGLGLAVTVEGRVVGRALRHLLLELAQAVLECDQVGAAGEHVVAQADVALARRALVVQRDTGVLLEHEVAAVDRRLAGEHPQERRLAGAVAARQRHALAALELERDVPEQRLAGHVLGQVGCDSDGHRC
jgi:hypothetical protein